MEWLFIVISVWSGVLGVLGLGSGTITIPSRHGDDLEIYRGEGKGCLFWFTILCLLSVSFGTGYMAFRIFSSYDEMYDPIESIESAPQSQIEKSGDVESHS